MSEYFLCNGFVLNAHSGAYKKTNIHIRGEKIVDIGGHLEPGIPQIDCSQKYLVPGIFDCHVHLVWDGASPDPMSDTERDGNYICFARGAQSALRSLKAGVTTVRDVGSNDDCAIPLAASIRRGLIPGSNVIPAGSAIQGAYGHCPMIGFIANTESQLIERIKQLKGYHVKMQTPPQHWIKIMASGGAAGLEDVGPCMYSPKELETIVYEAHRLNMKVAAHALSYDAISKCVDAGIDSIEHGADLTEELLQKMKAHNQAWVPTVGVYKCLSESTSVAPIIREKSIGVTVKQKEVFKAAMEIGTTIILGSDAGSADFGPHPSAFTEMFTMHEYGMSNLDIIRCATIYAADFLGTQGRGELAPGKIADIDILTADPLEDLHAFTEHLDSVYKEGTLVE